MNQPRPQLLDCTLRDGSYTIDFKFTARDTELIAGALDQAGVDLIEVGHGLGLNASSSNASMRAAARDDEYLAAAARAVTRGKWGTFFIPGIGRPEHISLAAAHGMHFIRIGANVTEVAGAAPHIEAAKAAGLLVSANFMKTYSLPPADIGRLAADAQRYGADIVCVVDSAGGMLPEDIEDYFRAIRDHSDVRIGFHGHDNLGLAIANTLRAVELGAAVVDASIRGIGRSAGNAVTEIIYFTLRRRGIELPLDVTRLMDLAERVIDPVIRNYQKTDSIGIVSGYAQFHSSYLGTVLEYAHRYRVDPRELILRVTDHDKIHAPPELVECLARSLAQERARGVRRFRVPPPTEASTVGLGPASRKVATDIAVRASKEGLTPAFNLVRRLQPDQRSFVSTVVHSGESVVFGSAELRNAEEISEVVRAIDPQVDYVLVDVGASLPPDDAWLAAAMQAATNAKLLRYQDLDVRGRAVAALAAGRLAQAHSATLGVFGAAGDLQGACCYHLRRLGFRVVTIEPTDTNGGWSTFSSGADLPLLVLCEPLSAETATRVPPGTFVVDALLGALDTAALARLASQGTLVCRAEMHGFIHAEIEALIAVHQTVHRRLGVRRVHGLTIAGGGIVAPAGAVVVDSVSDPESVFGVADGRGFLKPGDQLSTADKDHLQRTEELVMNHELQPEPPPTPTG